MIKELFEERNNIIKENREIYNEYEKIKSITLDGISNFNNDQVKIREIFFVAQEKLKGYKLEVKYIDHLINFLEQFKKKLVESIDKGESYIKTLQKPQEFKMYNLDIPKPKYESVSSIDNKINEIISKESKWNEK